MTPNEVVTEIVKRLQLGGSVLSVNFEPGELWCAEVIDKDGRETTYDFADLNTVAEVIRLSGDNMAWGVALVDCMGGTYRGCVGAVDSMQAEAHGETEAEALTRALLKNICIHRIGNEHMEPEEPWVDVSDRVSFENLPGHGTTCHLIGKKGSRMTEDWEWIYMQTAWVFEGVELKPRALGGTVTKWRYAE